MIFKKLQNLIKRGIQTLVANDSGIRQIAQVKFLGQTKQVKTLSPYGLFGSPLLNSDWLIFQARANSDDLYGIANYYKKRIKNLKEGEVVLMNVKTQDFIHFKEDGTIKHKASTLVEIEAPAVNVNSNNATFSGNVTVNGTLIVDGVTVNGHNHGGVETGTGNTGAMQ